jgi:hypothetical protein
MFRGSNKEKVVIKRKLSNKLSKVNRSRND